MFTEGQAKKYKFTNVRRYFAKSEINDYLDSVLTLMQFNYPVKKRMAPAHRLYFRQLVKFQQKHGRIDSRAKSNSFRKWVMESDDITDGSIRTAKTALKKQGWIVTEGPTTYYAADKLVKDLKSGYFVMSCQIEGVNINYEPEKKKV
jgi:hypothetical protein